MAIDAAFDGVEFGVGSRLDDAALVDDEDAVGVADGGEAVGDEEGGSSLHEGFEGLLDETLALGIEGAGGFVEDEDGRVAEDGACDGDALALTAGELDAAVADGGLVTLGEGLDEGVGVGETGGLFDLGLGGPGSTVGDVVGDRTTEQEDLLRDERELIAEIGERVVPGVAAVDDDAAPGGIVEAEQEGEQGGFAGAAGSHDGDLLTGLGVEFDALKDLDAGSGGVGEVDVLEGHLAAETGEGRGGLGGEGGLHLGSFAEEFADALGGTDSLLDLAVEVCELTHGPGHEGRVEDESGEFAEGDLAGLKEACAAPEDEDNRPEKGEHDERDERGAEPGAAERGLEEAEETGMVAAEFVGFVGEGLHVDDALERFLDDGGGLGETILGLAGESAGTASEEDRDQGQDGEAGQHDAGQLQGGGPDEHDATGEERHLAEELR